MLDSLLTLPERCTHASTLMQAFALVFRLLWFVKEKEGKSALKSEGDSLRARFLEDSEEFKSDVYDEKRKLSYDEDNACLNSSNYKHSIILSEALRQCGLEQFLAFTVQHSLNQDLITESIKLMQSLLFFRNPVNNRIMAETYAADDVATDIVACLVKIVDKWSEQDRAG